jgi:adenosine deaminase
MVMLPACLLQQISEMLLTPLAAKPRNPKLRSLPKAEVHVHLEGCFEAATLERWAAEAGLAMPRARERLFEFEGLSDFLHFLDWACGLANTTDRLAQLAYDFCRRLNEDGTGYADVIVNPTHWSAWRGRTKEMIEALDAGFASAERHGLPRVGLCVSLLRTQSAEEAIGLVDQLAAWRSPRVVALSVDGNEAAAGRTGPRFAAAFRKAGQAGFKRTVHAGESSGPEGVRDAIELLGADRIDHGVRAIEHDPVVALLAERGVALGICPTSNLVLKVYGTMDVHPLDRLRRAGVRVSINTDDPSLLGTNLPNEYEVAQRAYGWSDEILRELARTSIEASFADPPTKTRLLADLASWQA